MNKTILYIANWKCEKYFGGCNKEIKSGEYEVFIRTTKEDFSSVFVYHEECFLNNVYKKSPVSTNAWKIERHKRLFQWE